MFQKPKQIDWLIGLKSGETEHTKKENEDWIQPMPFTGSSPAVHNIFI